MLEPIDAKLLPLGRHGGIGIARNGHKGREIHLPGRERIRELEADAGRGRVGIDFEVRDPESMLLAQLLIDRAHIGIVLKLEARRIGVQRRAPVLPRCIDFAEKRKRRGFVGRVAARR